MSRQSSRNRRSRRRKWLTRLRTRLRYQRYSAVLRNRFFLVGATLVGLGILWIVVTGYLAHKQAQELATRIRQVKVLITQGHVEDARKLGADIPRMAARVDHLTSGPAWWIGAHVPFFGAPLDSARVTTAVISDIGRHAVPDLLAVAGDIDPARLRVNGHTVRLGPLAKAAPALADADRVLGAAVRRLAGGGTWLPVLDVGRAGFRAQVDQVRGYVDAAARVARIFPTMLGQQGTQKYFIALQNEAELRGTGGLPGAFAIASVTDGSVRFERFSSDTVLLPGKTQLIDTGLHFGPQFDALYQASQPTRLYVTSNLSPDFGTAARIWAAMWQKVSGDHVNGVIAVDPTAMSYFLGVTGPAVLPGYSTPLTSDNVVSLTERDEYALFPDNAARKKFLVSVVKVVSTKMISGAGSPLGLLQAASRAATEQRLLVWHENPTVEKALRETNYAGALPPPTSDRPFSGMIVNNAAAGKLDYYLNRSIGYARTGCGSRRDVVVTITLTNNAPASGLPPYVTTRLDHDKPKNVRPGDNRALVDYFATPDSRLQSVTLDGRTSVASAHQYLGHSVFRIDTELPRGGTRTIVLHLDEPARSGTPRIWRQPGVTPLGVDVFDQKCG